MNKYKVGEMVLFSTNSDSEEVKLYSEVGMVLAINKEIISIFQIQRYCGATMYKVNVNKVRPISYKEESIQEINEYYNDQIQKNEVLIKSIKRSDYNEEIVNKYYNLKTQIINTAKNMVELDNENDTDFENKLKAICQKKKELFTIECEDMNDARKYNGKVKYDIRELTRVRDMIIKDLEDHIDKLKSELGMEE